MNIDVAPTILALTGLAIPEIVQGDDHFTIPDATLSPESRALMVGSPDDVKERMQRMQIQYHIEVIRNHKNTLISG